MKKQTVKIYCDGSALGNPGPGGYGGVIETQTEQIIIKGGEIHTTNNRMEMRAVIESLSWLQKNHPEIITCEVISDSRLVIETLNSGWKRKKNTDLWAQLDALIVKFENITWHWVKGHSGHKQNTLADKYATEEAAKQQKNNKLKEPQKSHQIPKASFKVATRLSLF